MEQYNPQPLQQLIKGCVESNRDAQRKLYETYAGKMLAICIRYCGDRNTAQDLMHDGFINIFTHIKEYGNKGPFEGWMCRIMVNQSIDYLKRQRLELDATEAHTEMLYDDRQPSPFEQLSAKQIVEMIGKLPNIQRLVFNMHAVEGYTHGEIAERLGCNESTVRSHYARAKTMLKNMLEQ